MAQFQEFTFNSVILHVTDLTPTKQQKTIKQVIGKSLSQTPVIGLITQQWTLQINGRVLGTTSGNLSTNRAAIEGLDVAAPYAFVDGIHNGTYILDPGSLKFDDNQDDVNSSYTYSMTLIEE